MAFEILKSFELVSLSFLDYSPCLGDNVRMKTVLFATGNDRKLKEALAGCKGFDIKIEQIKLKIDEIQSNEPSEISLHKANAAFEITKKPIIISDTSWKIPSLNGFPGGYM